MQFNSISQIFYNFCIWYHILYIYFGCLILLLCMCNNTLTAFPPHQLNPVLLSSYSIVTSVPRTAPRVLAVTSQILNRCHLIKHDYQEVIPGEQGTNEMLLLLFSLSISVLHWKQQQRDQIVIIPSALAHKCHGCSACGCEMLTRALVVTAHNAAFVQTLFWLNCLKG